MISKRFSHLAPRVLVAVLCLILPAMPIASASVPAADESATPPVADCANGAFSTEEDFIARDIKPFDGNLYISDGDMLSFSGDVCMRNQDLTAAWFVGAVGPDLGLDALDILEIGKPIVAFSTEVDDASGRFTSGDLLFTPGWAIPNLALVSPFNIKWDIGLDGVQFIGKIADILRFVNTLPNHPREQFLQNPSMLQSLLKEYSIDIWFTVEGTAFIGTRSQVLDGDLLSAATGTIVVPQSALLPADVPAGLTLRGVDFGLDGIATPRDPDLARKVLFFSTEILYQGEKTPFTDGDVLRLGNGIERTNWDLIQPFHPAADFLGLDALSVGSPGPVGDPNIQKLCGDQRFVSEFDGGLVPINGSGSGLYKGVFTDDPRGQPCGLYVPVDGFVPPAAGVTKFRVAYRPSGTAAPGAVDDPATPGIRTRWRLAVPRPFWPFGCFIPSEGSVLEQLLETDTRGWMNANDWFKAYDGTLTGCVNHNLRLAVWDTNNSQGLGWNPPDPNGHYVLWLEWQDGGGLHREPVEHNLQLDNKLPTIAPYPNGLQVYVNNPDGTRGSQVVACGSEKTGASKFQIWGQFADDYYSRFSLRVVGGGPPTAIAGFGPHRWWDPNDGTLGIKNTDDTGTAPNLTTVQLRNIDMAAALGAAFTNCCYLLDLWVYDASIRHAFDKVVATDVSGDYYAYQPITFAAGP